MMHWDWCRSWGMGGYGGFMMILFWGLLIAGVVFVVRLLAGSSKSASGETPLDILKKRYARGEINKTEYDEKLKDLQ